MNYLMQRIDQDTAWFIAAVLVIMLLSAIAGVIGAKLEVRELTHKRQMQEERRREEFLASLYRDVDTPTFIREARHPMDSAPYNIHKIN
jgi:hypothetical protein